MFALRCIIGANHRIQAVLGTKFLSVVHFSNGTFRGGSLLARWNRHTDNVVRSTCIDGRHGLLLCRVGSQRVVLRKNRVLTTLANRNVLLIVGVVVLGTRLSDIEGDDVLLHINGRIILIESTEVYTITTTEDRDTSLRDLELLISTNASIQFLVIIESDRRVETYLKVLLLPGNREEGNGEEDGQVILLKG